MLNRLQSINNIQKDIEDTKELSKIKTAIENLKMYSNNPSMLKKEYTEILNSDNVIFLLTKVSQDPIFKQHFPEFYIKNEFGEDVINCQQNNTYHRYGVFKHILYTIELVGASNTHLSEWQKMILKWTMLLHDIGKPYVKKLNSAGYDSFAGHDDKSVELAINILSRFEFSKEDTKIILTLIKYHDRFLNEGEITYDNLKFLASELENKKDLFYLLINVKDADANAKSIDVYNKYKLTKTKYLSFANSYFEKTEILDANEQVITNININEKASRNYEITDESKIEDLITDVLMRKNITVLYQPIIDIKSSKILGYETYSVINKDKKISITKFLRYAKNTDKYDKIQQMLFLNAVEKFEIIETRQANNIFVNIDLESYEKYINKPRIYDMMQRVQINLELHNYESIDLTSLDEKINLIKKNGGKVVLDHLGIGNINIDDLNRLRPTYVKPDISMIVGIETDIEKQKYITDLLTYCLASNVQLIAVGIETKEQYEVLKSLGVSYMQGYYFAYPSNFIESMDVKLEKTLNNNEDESIV